MRKRTGQNLEVLHCPLCGAWYLVREPARAKPLLPGWPRWFQCHRCQRRVASRVHRSPVRATAASPGA